MQRDELFERSRRDFQRIGQELDRIREEHPAEFEKAMVAFALEARRSAAEQGPGSEAARQFRHVLNVAQYAHQQHSHRRRQRSSAPPHIDLADPSIHARYEQAAAELLTSPPSADDTVIAIPPEGQDSGRGRTFLRIGIGKASWVGSFERGHTRVNTVGMLPDGKHLFVSAEGAGYVIDAQSRTLVERSGTHVIGTMGDKDALTLFVVDHNGMSLEAFGRTGRLWKTDTISSGGFRQMTIMPDELVGEVRHLSGMGWARFSVKLATGEVEIAAPDVWKK